MAKYLTEFIGTFFLVLSISLAVLQQAPLAPLAIGATLMVMVYMGGHVSGAHYNPAVSFAALLRGKLGLIDFGVYVIVQIVAAVAASAVALVILGKGKTFAPGPGKDVTVIAALLVEGLYTFALALVVLNVATAKKTANNSFYGLAIGFTVAAGVVVAGDVSGAVFNPAVGIGPTVVHAWQGGGSLEHLWIYLVGPLTGGAVAAAVFRIQEAQS